MKESKECNLASALQQVIRPQTTASKQGRPDSKAGKKKAKKKDDKDLEPPKVLKSRVKYNTVVYGLPHAIFDR